MKKVLINGLEQDHIEILLNFMKDKTKDLSYINSIEIGGNECNIDWIEDGMDISNDDMLH